MTHMASFEYRRNFVNKVAAANLDELIKARDAIIEQGAESEDREARRDARKQLEVLEAIAAYKYPESWEND